MAGNIAPLRLGSRVCFEDRWQGHVSALDVTEDWEVLNLTVSSGVLFFQQSVKLPMSAVKSLTEEAVYIAASSIRRRSRARYRRSPRPRAPSPPRRPSPGAAPASQASS